MESSKDTSKILIVDDDPTSSIILREYLRPYDYDIYCIEAPGRALQAVREIKPDLVLLDIMMPGLSGLDLCRSLKQDEAIQSIPVLFVSAFSDRHSYKQAIECGGAGLVSKPFDPELVQAFVKMLLKRSAGVRTEAARSSI